MDISEIRSLQAFPSKKEMDLRVRAFLYHHKAELSSGTLDVLRFIWRHSVKYPGVSFAKIETIMLKTLRSRSTVIRAINTLEEKGLLTRIPNTRPNGKRGVNILVINASTEEQLPSEDAGVSTTNEKASSPIKIPQEKASAIKSTKQVIDADYLPSYIPDAFIALTQSFLNVNEILSAWNSVRRVYEVYNLNYPVEHYLQAIIRTFKQAVFAKQNGWIKKTFLGYFYGGMKATFTQLVRKEVMSDPANLYFDWLDSSS
ncbi:helix-turn-helix domain-containing protein [Thalassobacillus pellis]|uniref:helix-turn-helix domain-containing protein n=1 Tax=Thalassobacillus pellis TaxID=748008 RepID=UPI00195FB6D2|nr:helix-turn-helix domain-containing protein [Thalassobacillus pellis]MBM7553222.1 DNA-binding MarR family transcriptional regulator [Thalassobacillus pellis]